MLYKMMYYADPFDGKLGILNARYRAPDYPPFTPKMHELLSAFYPAHLFSSSLSPLYSFSFVGIEFLLNPDPAKRPDICDVLDKLGTSVPRIKRKSARSSSSPSTKGAPYHSTLQLF